MDQLLGNDMQIAVLYRCLMPPLLIFMPLAAAGWTEKRKKSTN